MEAHGDTWIPGYPRIGGDRELKKALEAFWTGRIDRKALDEEGRRIRAGSWNDQVRAGMYRVCAGDFSWYDRMGDMSLMLGACPERHRDIPDPRDRLFAMARGREGAPPLAMKKWFHTNYHYLVPELEPGTEWKADPSLLEDALEEAHALGYRVVLSLIGPLTFLALSRLAPGLDRDTAAGAVGSTWVELVQGLAGRFPDMLIQMEEPVLACGSDGRDHAFLTRIVLALQDGPARDRLVVHIPYGHAAEAVPVLASLPLRALGLDMAEGREGNCRALESWRRSAGPDAEPPVLVAGVVPGRNVWRTSMDHARSLLAHLETLAGPGRVVPSVSCSLLHVPLSLERETDLAPEVRSTMAFAKEKLGEVADLAAWRARRDRRDTAYRDEAGAAPDGAGILIPAGTAARETGEEPLSGTVPPRQMPRQERRRIQDNVLPLPVLPLTTIGSFPQTRALRDLRAAWRRGEVGDADYRQVLEESTRECISLQEDLGLDVLVHGEFERNDMVEFFAGALEGCACTTRGWVQSYGSRCVKPGVIHGPVRRKAAMTVDTIRHAQSCTSLPVKGMLTGPVTILNWCFVHEGESRETTCRRIALALKEEVLELEAAGIRIIQVDEAALKEGYPLRQCDRKAYEDMAVDCFRLATNGVRPETRIHSHMCYSNFTDILPVLEAMDFDALSIESTRDGTELLDAFARGGYSGELGPGVWDIHSPVVPGVAELEDAIRSRLAMLGPRRLWVNPDCGLKTRDWDQVRQALASMVEATRRVRAGLRPD